MAASSDSLLQDATQRQRAVAWALRFTEDTPLAPDPYERALLTRFIEGKLTLEQVLERLEAKAAKP